MLTVLMSMLFRSRNPYFISETIERHWLLAATMLTVP